jgi:hypothetical protein
MRHKSRREHFVLALIPLTILYQILICIIGQFNVMSRQGILITDGFSKICLGIFFGCIGLVFLSLFISFDPNAMVSPTASDLAGLIIAILIPTALLDVGLFLVIEGWKGRYTSLDQDKNNLGRVHPTGVSTDGGAAAEEQQKAMQLVASGMSMINVIYVWTQRLIGAFAVIVALSVTAIFWLQPILDLVSGKGSFKWGFLLMLGLILGSFVVIIAYFLLLKRPRANPYEQ